MQIFNNRDSFYQWDLNQKLIIKDSSITEVHFCNRTDNCSLVCAVYYDARTLQRVVNVPNILLQDNWDIRAYGYCGDCYTKQSATFKVIARTKPADYVYTETEIKNWDSLEARIYSCEDEDIRIYQRIDEVEAEALGAVSGIVYMTYAEMVEALNGADTELLKKPEHILIQTIGVPDLWVMDIAAEPVVYEYVDDQSLADDVTTGAVQIGHYIVSALETQKVDLSEYAKKAQMPVIEYHLKDNGAYTLIITKGVD